VGRGLRPQTHRRAAMGGFIQDDGYVRGVAPTHKLSSGSFLDFGFQATFGQNAILLITKSLIQILVPGQYHLSRCLE
jgi:hypothetical protein